MFITSLTRFGALYYGNCACIIIRYAWLKSSHKTYWTNPQRTKINYQDEHPIAAAALDAGASLQTLTKAAIARKRKLPVNDHKVKQNSKTTVGVKISAWDRLKDFPNHHFAVVDQKLRYKARCEDVSLKKSSITKQMESAKHKKNLSDIAKNKNRRSLNVCKEEIRGETELGLSLLANMQLFRLEVTQNLFFVLKYH